jgi:hypothetical protein
MKQILTDDEVSIPHEAVDYINNKFKGCRCTPFTFEVVEAFFEWLSVQPLEAQKRILRKAMNHGRTSVEISRRFTEKVR